MKYSHYAVTALISGMVTFSAPAVAQAECEGETQVEMNECTHISFEDADKDLNKVYAEVLASLAQTPEEADNLRKAQRAWIAFRDADCYFSGSAARGGSMEGMVITMCQTERTQERTKNLESALENN